MARLSNFCSDCGRLTEWVVNRQPICDSCLKTIASRLEGKLVIEKQTSEPTAACPVCQTTVSDFESDDRFGCPSCYSYLRGAAKAALKGIIDATARN